MLVSEAGFFSALTKLAILIPTQGHSRIWIDLVKTNSFAFLHETEDDKYLDHMDFIDLCSLIFNMHNFWKNV